MTYFPRRIDLNNLLKQKSFFLLGPRATGKTEAIKHQLKDALAFNLLDAEVYSTLLKRPKTIEEIWRERPDKDSAIIVIDEIQKLPQLLDEVHRLLNLHDIRFLLTGSSARKLRRGAANLLAGRAWQADLFPLVSTEIPNFHLLRYLNRGGLPAVYLSDSPVEELRSYTGLYLREEIQAESATRNLPAFSSFLDAIALSNGHEIQYDSLASDCGVSPGTVKNYLQILDDTLLGFRLEPFTKTKKRKAITRSKYYLFDIGVVNQLCHRNGIQERSELFGNAFEHFIVLEMRAWNSYSRSFLPLFFWRSTSQFEVDLIVGNKIAIEIKSTHQVQDKHLKHLRRLKEEGLIERYCVVSLDPVRRKTDDDILICPWQEFLTTLWRKGVDGVGQ